MMGASLGSAGDTTIGCLLALLLPLTVLRRLWRAVS